MGFMDTLFGSTPEVTLPPAIKADIANLQYIPFGPERDALIDRLTTTYGLSSDLFDSELGSLGQYLTKSEETQMGAIGNMQGIANQMQGFAGTDPYMQFYGNPAAREQQYLEAMQEANAAAFDPYGSVGSESEQRRGLMKADAARRGITNSGIASRQQEQEQQRYAALQAEAAGKALQGARQQGLGEAQAYQSARGLASQNLGQSGDIQAQIAQIAQQMPQQRMKATELYGKAAIDAGTMIGGAQSEQRSNQQDVQNYNTEVQNKVLQDYASVQNQRNAMQAGLDASRRKPGIMDMVGPLVQAGASAYGAFKGGGGAGGLGKALAGAGSAAMQGAQQSSPQQQPSWNPQMPQQPNYQDMSRYGQRSPASSNDFWSNYSRGGF